MNPVMVLTATFNARRVGLLEASPGYTWYRCRSCGEHQKRRREKVQPHCIMTPGCRGTMDTYLEACCQVCGRALTRRSRDGFCTLKCRAAAG